MALSIKRSTDRYVDALGFTNEPAPSSLSNLSRGGIHPAQSFMKSTGFGDMEGIFSRLRKTAGRMPGLVANSAVAPPGFRHHPSHTVKKRSGFRDDTFRQQHAPNRRVRPTPWATPFHLAPQPRSMLPMAQAPTGMGNVWDAQLGALLQGLEGPGHHGHRGRRRHRHPAYSTPHGMAALLNGGEGLDGGVLDTLTSDASGILDSANAKVEKLQNALYIIIGLSGVAAATGLLSAFRSK